MKQRPRRYITDSEMAVIWDRWEKGDSINAIARDLGRYHSAVQGAMARTGGIRPADRQRRRVPVSVPLARRITRYPARLYPPSVAAPEWQSRALTPYRQPRILPTDRSERYL